MKFIIKVSKCCLSYCSFITMLAFMPIASYAQTIVDISSPQDHLVEPAIVMTESAVEPDCHTYTGCSLVVLKKYHYHTPIHHKYKRHHVYHPSYCGSCYERSVIGPCW